MKLQSYYFSDSGNAKALAAAIAKEYSLKVDQIPPAYQPDRDAIVFISFDSGSVADKLRNFCRSLTPAKAKNVALAVVGKNDAGLSEVQKLLEGVGVNVFPDFYRCTLKSGLFSKGKISEEQVAEGVAWAKKLVDSYAE